PARARRLRGRRRHRARSTRAACASAVTREEAGQILPRLAGDQEHVVDPREVHGRLEDRVMEECRAAVVDGSHAPDGDAPWKHPALPRRDEHVTDLDLRAVARHVLEPEHAARLALDDAWCTRPEDVV